MDWTHQLSASAIWLAEAFLITLAVSAIGCWLLIRRTVWGAQFWRLAKPFLHPKNGWRPLLTVLLILLLTLAGVRLSVLFSNWYNGMYSSLQNLDEKAFWTSMLLFAVLASVHVGRALFDFYIKQAFVLRWRESLNETLLQKWLDRQAHYRSNFLEKNSDNPDQRIQQDIGSFVGSSLSLSMGVIDALVSTFEFTLILWGLSGVLHLFGYDIPRGMVFAVYVYVIASTFAAVWIGRPLIRLNFLNEKLGADYRYALVRIREYGESIAFYRGEQVEGNTLRQRFAAVISNAWDIVFRSLKFQGFNFIVSQTAAVFPFMIQAKRFFDKQISLGDMVQTAQAFGQLQDNLSFFRNAYDSFAEYKAVLDRLTGFLDAAEAAVELPQARQQISSEGLRLSGLTVRKPDQSLLLDKLSLQLAAGDALLIRGPSGSGKTTLLRAIAGLWPYCEGEVAHPAPEQMLFLSQKPYLPLGTLAAALCYPYPRRDDATLHTALKTVQLGHLLSQLDTVADWSRILSLGEQQRLAFGRLLLAAPQVAFLDEASSAMDEGLEEALYRLVREQLPQTTLVSVGHRSSLLVHHNRQLQLNGDGRWQNAG